MNQKIINLGKYQIYINKRIGFGWHSATYQCIDTKNLNVQIVAKIYKNSQLTPEIPIERIKEAQHDNIVKVFDIIQHDQDVIIIMERCYSNLRNLIHQKREYHDQDVLNYLRQLLSGYNYVKERNLALPDLKPTNILVDEYDTIKLSNFGIRSLYTRIDNEIRPFAAPEVFFSKVQTNSKDIYALGLILYQLLYNQLPFQLRSNGDVLIFVQKLKKQNLALAEHSCNKIVQLIQKMVHYNEQDRISIEQLCEYLDIHQIKRKPRRILSIQPVAAKADELQFS